MSETREVSAKKVLTLVMPVYHEGDAIIPVIATLFLTVQHPFKLIVVYDSDDDPTVATVQKLRQHFEPVYLIQNEWREGALNAVRTGLRHADTRYVGIWVAYHLDPFRIVDDMVEKLESGCDLVSANRFTIGSATARGNYIKRALSYAGNIVLNKIIGMPISDVTTSIKIYRRDMLDSLAIDWEVTGGWAVSSELAIKAAIAGYRLEEIPLERKNVNLIHGITRFAVFRQLPTYFKWLFLGWRKRNLIKTSVRCQNGS
jgi:glycosyltransferase involved in cell wall biosynthesis